MPKSTQAQQNGSDRPKILIVDPIADIRERCAKIFQSIQVDVAVVSNGMEALSYLRQAGMPDLAIIELTIEDIGGIELANQIYQQGKIPIMMTGYDVEVSTIVNLLKSVAVDFVRKPVNERELVARALRFLPGMSRLARMHLVLC